MSVNIEWDVLQRINSPFGDVILNEPAALLGSDGQAWLFQTMIDGYQIVPGKFRPVVDSFSQADGSSIQPPWIDGMVASFEVSYWVCPNGDEASKEPACGEDLRLMNEYLMGILNSLRQLRQNPLLSQYRWRPTGLNYDRLLNGVMLAAWNPPDFTQGPKEVRLKIELASPYPYAVDDNASTVAIAQGSLGGDVLNAGNCDLYTVIRAYGPSSAFVVENLESGFLISYDSSRPGGTAIPGGHFAEIDCFTGTVHADGDTDENSNLIASVDPRATDFFPLKPGVNTLIATGADIQVSQQSAWV